MDAKTPYIYEIFILYIFVKVINFKRILLWYNKNEGIHKAT